MSTDHLQPEVPREQHANRPSGWHTVNVGHLVMGVAFVGLFAVWALITTGVVDPEREQWIFPAPWLLAGAIGLLATLLRGRGSTYSGRMKGWLPPDSPSSHG